MPLDAPRPSLDKLFRPRAIAVVGASRRVESFGYRTIDALRRHDFPGPVYPVNPRYDEVAGLVCHPSLDALPGPVDLAYLAVAAAHAPDVLEQAGRLGIGGAVVTASGFADGGPEGAALQRRLEAAAARHGIALCGPNNMGFINLHDRVVSWPAPIPEDSHAGPVALITQSGSVGIAMTQDERALGFGYMVTAGNEATVTAADYLDYFVRDDRVRVVLMFLETIRDPVRFAAAAAEARARAKHLIAVKVGHSEVGRRTVAAHTGAIAGENAVYRAFFRRHGVMRAADIDGLLEMAVLVTVAPGPPPSPHVAPVTLSGGEAALLADMGERYGLSMPALAPETVAGLRPHFPPFAVPRNPVDAYGLGWDVGRFGDLIEALLGDPRLGVVALCMDSTERGGGDVGYIREMAEICGRLAPRTDKRIVYVNNTSVGGMDRVARDRFAALGVPALVGMREGLAALAEWTRAATATRPPDAAPPATAEAWCARARGPLDEPARFALLADAGLPMAPTRPVASAAEAVAAAAVLGYPLVLKGSAPDLMHKTEHDLVRLGLADEDAVARAFEELLAATRALVGASPGAGVVAQPMAGPGIELILGARAEPGFGMALAVGLGGTLVELVGRASVRLAPVDEGEARAMLAETPAGRLIAGARGRGPCDLDAALEAIVVFSRFAAATEGVLTAVEINPLIVLEAGRGAIGVDAVIERVPATDAPAEVAAP